MYAYLRGKLIEKTATGAVLEVHGVGFQLQIPVSTYETLPGLGDEVRLLTHFVVREDAQALYGFSTEDERKLFCLLISVSGIGPKIAMTIMSGIRITDLKRAIVEGRLEILQAIPGVGKKTAERLVVELREKLADEADRFAPDPGIKTDLPSSLIKDAMEALTALGYRRTEAKTAVEKVVRSDPKEVFTVEKLVRDSLKYIR
ncbi:MAG: Holliday junction branch migration protein RuvA [Candidatus Omnitrophota bacterium]